MQEFGYGMFDGITGLITQPMEGAKKEGAAGFIKGFGRGIGGVVFKPGAAIFGIPAYTMKGVYKELQQHLGSSVQNYIIAARTAQGYDDWHNSSVGERQDIVMRWGIVQQNLKKKRNPHEHLQDLVMDTRRRYQFSESDGKTGKDSKTKDLSRAESTFTSQSPRITLTDSSSSAPAEMNPSIESAIHASVAETSQGNSEQDALIERAIRASMAELSASGNRSGATNAADDTDDEEGEALYRAMEASLATAQEHREQHGADSGDEELEKALAASLAERRAAGAGAGTHDPEDYEDDEDVEKALLASRAEHSATGTGENEEEMEKAVKESERHAEEERRKQEEEERVVMEYVKKQSLMEEEHRRKAGGKGKEVQASKHDDGEDEELEWAMKLSLARDGQEGEASK